MFDSGKSVKRPIKRLYPLDESATEGNQVNKGNSDNQNTPEPLLESTETIGWVRTGCCEKCMLRLKQGQMIKHF